MRVQLSGDERGGRMQAPLAGDPDWIGPFLILGRLGAGGMGTVYLAKSPGGRRVAVKTIHAEHAVDPTFRERFRREVDAARRVSGFWTAPVVDADVDAPMPWVATAYVDAPNLNEYVRRHGPPTGSALHLLAAGLGEALDAIHQTGLVHRDLKPANILITDDGPRIIDFGIARVEYNNVTLTAHGGIIGTPGYMSPEQAQGETATSASDVFSLGAVLYYAATGQDPFGCGNVPALLYRVVHDEPDFSTFPTELLLAVFGCLSKDPAERPTAINVLYLLDNPVTAADDGAPTGRTSPDSEVGPWWEQPTRTARNLSPPPPTRPPNAASSPDVNAWWSAGPDELAPIEPAPDSASEFPVGMRAVEQYRAERNASVPRYGPLGVSFDGLDVGDVVEHTKFGVGTVLDVQGDGQNVQVTVSFGPRRRVKRLLVRYAPMRKIEAW
ncbi:serine/threonine-protein kinase [Streptomyces sp. NPDC050439]|uniref:serine/threonine-protein kinase n=1 Tax=unclassified Streptomyces TaxID=2593676 RepID=UPI003423036F